MKLSSRIFAIAVFAGIGLLGAWGAWLLATDDPQGGRHLTGGAMLVVALILGLLGILSLRRSRP